MLGILPLIFLGLVCFYIAHNSQYGRRQAFIISLLVLGLVVVVFTEGLSCFKAINRPAIAICWLVAVLVTAALAWSAVKTRANSSTTPRSQWTKELIALAFLIGFILTITLIVALFSAPNNWDSLTYHLSRVRHWIQNGHVGFYQTNIPRQLYSNPMAEYAILNLCLLYGSDLLANAVQWLAMLGSIVTVSLLAQTLGYGWRCQLSAALVAACLPMGILQSCSTQNDYVLALWLSIFVYFLYQWSKTKRDGDCLLAALSLGLAILTKGSAYLFAAPFFLGTACYFVIQAYRQGKWPWRKTFAPILGLIIVLLINGKHLARNYENFGRLLGPNNEGPGCIFTNDNYSLAAFCSNILRNLALHLETPFADINQELNDGIDFLHRTLGISPNDPSTTWGGTSFAINETVIHEDLASNLLHIIMIAGCFTWVYLNRKKLGEKIVTLTTAVIASFLLFCFLLRWQPWHSRLHLPLFVLASPVIGIVIGSIRFFAARWLLYLLLFASAYSYLFFNKSRPLVGPANILQAPRQEQYFINKNHQTFIDYAQISDLIKKNHYQLIGLWFGGDDWEYPLWALLDPELKGTPRLEHIASPITTLKKMSTPDGIVTGAWQKYPKLLTVIDYNGQSYFLVTHNCELNLYLRQPELSQKYP